MKVDKYFLRVIGVLIVVSVLLGFYHSMYWLWLTALIGLSLFQFSFTNFCPLGFILEKLGIKE